MSPFWSFLNNNPGWSFLFALIILGSIERIVHYVMIGRRRQQAYQMTERGGRDSANRV